MADRKLVVLVDEGGNELGSHDKRAAHEPPGHLHLAFSAFLFRGDGALLCQRRSSGKYHFPGIWANSCCSHPEPGEELVASAVHRVSEELGLACSLRDVGSFVYVATDPVSGLVEHELDHVLVGEVPASAVPVPDPAEVEELAWMVPLEIASYGADEGFAPWFAEALAIAISGRAG